MVDLLVFHWPFLLSPYYSTPFLYKSNLKMETTTKKYNKDNINKGFKKKEIYK